ncbi:hypothetical protein AVDCRST_MAG94-1555 [uncultured Leptolyngbya sp.]|uniref:Uncharacterized protein n=1 Tax=uncultured Leptolyngbya sp. TaxID=332963 RepID=A0A6J4L622_9CYAN|nr:hypothetical protein AVDCRST_MAG94-1555 [uncultured Leptolyngbya sp.]
MKTTFRHFWASKSDEAQLSDKSKKCKAPTKEQQESDYHAQNSTIDVVAEVLEVEPLRIQRS